VKYKIAIKQIFTLFFTNWLWRIDWPWRISGGSWCVLLWVCYTFEFIRCPCSSSNPSDSIL